MHELNANEIKEVNGGWAKIVFKEVVRSTAAGVVYDAVKASWPEPKTSRGGQMSRHNYNYKRNNIWR